MRVEPALDQPSQIEAVEHVRERRRLVAELGLELTDRERAAAVELGEHVRLGLGNAELAGGPLDVDGDEVDSSFEICDHFHMGYYDMGMTDNELLQAFESGALTGADFPHERHVRVTWLLTQRDGLEQARETVARGIRGIAERAGNPAAFHVTITRAWCELIAAADDLESLPELLDRSLLSHYYSARALESGRERWVEPDLAPLRLPPPPRPEVDLVSVMRQVPAAVAVLSAKSGGDVHATTVSSVTSVSRRPPLVLVCLAEGSRALELASEAGAFTLSFLASGQEDVAARFADGARPAGHAQFAGVPHRLTPQGPVIAGAAAWLGCTMSAVHPGGDHRVVVGEVASADVGDGHPLVRHDGAFL